MSFSSSSAYSSGGCPPQDCEPLTEVTRCPPKACKPKPKCAPKRQACRPKPKCVKRVPQRNACPPKREACVPRRACVDNDGEVNPRREQPAQDGSAQGSGGQGSSAQGSGGSQQSMAIDIADMGASVDVDLGCNTCQKKKKKRQCKPCGQ